MSARIVVISSSEPRAGKTHLAAALARWLSTAGHAVEVLHLGRAGEAKVAASDGAVISRNAAILAEAAGVASGARHEKPEALGELAAAAEFVLVESAGPGPDGAHASIQLQRAEGAYRIDGFGKLPSWSGPAIVPDTPPDVAAMEPFRVGGWPRIGVVTLPHLDNFSDFRLLRGAEWLTAPAPGRFAAVFLPATSDPPADTVWMENQGLAEWLAQQREQGCRVIATGWKAHGSEVIEAADFQNPATVSRLLGRRVDAPLPDEQVYDRLAGWLASWSRFKALIQRVGGMVVQ